MQAFQHIMVAICPDNDEELALGRSLIDTACNLAKPLGARLTLVHVAPPVMPGLGAAWDVTGVQQSVLVDVNNSQAEYDRKALDILLDEIAQRGVQASAVVCTEAGDVADLLVKTAEEKKVDLIVLMSHGRKGLERLLLGSVSEAVVRKTTLPVLFLHPEKLVGAPQP